MHYRLLKINFNIALKSKGFIISVGFLGVILLESIVNYLIILNNIVIHNYQVAKNGWPTLVLFSYCAYALCIYKFET